ncbi:MAG: hypothetical protein ACRDYC_01905 [Acidimicrobiales bacterium]
MIAALAQQDLNFWWIALGLGAVVILVVILLLGFLATLIRDIQINVEDALDMAGGIAGNTRNIQVLGAAVGLTRDLKDELGNHVMWLRKVQGDL